jgi:hypothetical protein
VSSLSAPCKRIINAAARGNRTRAQ